MKLDALDKRLLETIADLHGVPAGAFNIRRNGQAVERRSTANIEIRSKEDKPGIDVLIRPGTRNESVHIPVILAASGMTDVVYNTFEIGEDSDVLIVAGCGIHNPGEAEARHDGIHEFFVRRGARVRYVEKHYGEGPGPGARILNPQTIVHVEEGAEMILETVQIRGVDDTQRVTSARVASRGRLFMTERLLTHGTQRAISDVTVELIGEEASAEVISRSVAQDESEQLFRPRLIATAPARGHVACDSIIMDRARISSVPEISARHPEAELTHEAAIGKIAGDQLIKLMTLGLTEKEAIETILRGFLR
ncbi:MAG: SufD family Fe-S cluster assembly protein [Bacillota bacterium]|nr:SufD family Fe-S cluster assembly protein [Bacillota bacterium]